MNILVLTAINSAEASDIFYKVMTHFGRLAEEKEKDNVVVFSYPFVAEMTKELQDMEYLPAVFGLMNTAKKDKKIYKQVFNKEHKILVGNDYKGKYDFVVCLQHDEEDGPFDPYLDFILNDESMSSFAAKVNAKDLYRLEDVDIFLPTLDHLFLFLEEAIYGRNSTKR